MDVVVGSLVLVSVHFLGLAGLHFHAVRDAVVVVSLMLVLVRFLGLVWLDVHVVRVAADVAADVAAWCVLVSALLLLWMRWNRLRQLLRMIFGRFLAETKRHIVSVRRRTKCFSPS